MGDREQYRTKIRCLLFAESCLKTILRDPPVLGCFSELSDAQPGQHNQAIPSMLGIGKKRTPASLGYEASGVVVGVGAGVSNEQVGKIVLTVD